MQATEPVLPSFTQSRSFDSDQDGNCGSTAEDSSMASESMTSQSTNNTMSSPGGGSVAKSARFKSAMTSRARQRRMRRMKENGSETPGSPLPPTSPPSADKAVSAGKEQHVEQMKAYRRVVGSAPSSSPTPNSPTANMPPPSPPAVTNSPLQNRAYEKARSRSLDRRSRESPPLPSVAVTPQRSNSTNKEAAAATRQTRREKQLAEAAKAEEFLPDWKKHGRLSPDEVRDAANYTSVQFQCSNLSGEVEMFSDESVFSGTDSGMRVVGEEFEGAAIGAVDNNNNQCWNNEVWSEATTPTILRNGEIFHQKAAASIVSLLSPSRMFEAGLMAPEINNSEEDDASKDVEGDSPTGVQVPFTFRGDDDPGSSRGGEWSGMTQVNRTLFRDDLDDDVKQSMIFNSFRKNMMQPSSQLSDLLSQINCKGWAHTHTADIDRNFATRRKNACGALKILSAKQENRMKICWTIGVLPAIASVLSDANDSEITDEFVRDANTEARNRIVSTLLNLSVNKKNRMLIVNTPGVLESISETIQYDNGEGRQGCCTVLLYLAKTTEARTMIVKSAGMLDVLTKVIEVPKEELPKDEPTKSQKMSMKQCQASQPLTPGSPDTGRSSRRSRSHRSRRDDDESRSHSSNDSDENSSLSSKGSGADRNLSRESHAPPDVSIASAQTTESHAASSGAVEADGEEKENEGKEEKIGKSEEDMYDADPNHFLHGARLSVFACLLCLVKTKENAFTLAREQNLVEVLISISKRHSSPSHSRAMAILAHLTRHPKNSHQLVYKYASLLPMLQATTASPDKEARRYVFCALQNLSMDKSCRAPVAHSPKIIWSLTQRCKEKSGGDEDEARMAAVATLQNLADEPANLIQFTIVKDCIGTIIQIAREDVVRGDRTDLTSFMAKNTLVTLSHWFRKIATSGCERIGRHGPSASAGFPPGGGSPGGSTLSPGGTTGTRTTLHTARLDPTNYNQWS